MPKKRLTAIVDKYVWEKVTKGRAGIRWDNVAQEEWKDILRGTLVNRTYGVHKNLYM